MKQKELDRQVARATGETIELVERRGFSPLFVHSSTVEAEIHRQPKWVDWDELDAQRYGCLAPPECFKQLS